MSIITAGLTYGPKSTLRVLPLADVAYGPCEPGASFFCEGRGTETVDPRAMVDIRTAFRTAIMCGPCRVALEDSVALESVA